jgi:hypothetical protein
MMQFLVIAEAPADSELAIVLSERVLKEHAPEWLLDNWESLQPLEWVGLEDYSSFTAWKNLKSIFRRDFPQTRSLGHVRGKPLTSDGVLARKVLVVSSLLKEQKLTSLKGVLFIRDMDSQKAERLAAMNLVREHFDTDLSMILACPDPKRESWVLHGFEPEDEEERHLLRKCIAELGFEPRTDSHRLRGKHGELRDGKRVLAFLTGGDFLREQRCYQDTSLDTLRQRGQESGLADFLEELEQRLVPLLKDE